MHSKIFRLSCACSLLATLGTFDALMRAAKPSPILAYSIRIDAAHPDVADVAIQFHNAPARFHLAMRVHAEYDARYWRYLDSLRVERTSRTEAAAVVREDSTLWRVSVPGGQGVVRYRVHLQPPRAGVRDSWRPYARADGAFINGPDFFLYVPELPNAPIRLDLNIPREWKVATSLASRGTPAQRSASDAATLLDSPILLGALREWSFVEAGTRYHVVYWPLPDAVPFDTTAFVDGIHRLTRAALDVFHRAPSSEYYFLIQDGASDALEHRASLAIGVPSVRLTRDPHALLPEIAHEFFHTWNLVAIRPAGYNDLSYRAGARTPSLWVGEGVTLHYADVLLRRAGLADTVRSRLSHLAELLQRYYGSPAVMRVSPERASLAFGDSPVTNPDATGGYYLQGELLGEIVDAMVRDSTHERRGLDDVIRVLFDRSRLPGDHGFTSPVLESVIDSVCACRMDVLFANQVRGAGPIDITPVLRRLGLRLALDSVQAVDSAGHALPDLRLRGDFTSPAPVGPIRLVVTNPSTAWGRAGLRTGDELVALNGTSVRTFDELRGALGALHIDDRITVDIRRVGQTTSLSVPVTGYVQPRIRFLDAVDATLEQRALRRAWNAGR